MNIEDNSNKLTLQMVKVAVYSWSIRHKEAGYANEQLARISQEYFEDLESEGVTARQFDSAARDVRKRTRFFPKMADVLASVSAYRERPPQATKGIAMIESTTSQHDLTEEEISRNKERVKTITDMLAGKMSIDEAEVMVSGQGHIMDFNGNRGNEACSR